MTEKALTVAQVAERLQLTVRTIRKFLREGKIRGIKTSEGKGGDWRIPESALEEYLRGERPEPSKAED